ncbi:YbaB/EbfC family nucleoid-associated protein [Actinophytocola gossypii]|uniref:YbaB/EbfC family nucleoid-associated protein n=1 Tax=Actinophytocola gossypii TaxID=2812003 RepID=A0ABT2JJ00_9PSEU|nr:YbaB/EbfC family nucleoid-associated protein [Actinophytocola gossypii]MCT2587696.1 YbaB/EbfC family nucleoid-associated protein [Actinophytocola gossypii]
MTEGIPNDLFRGDPQDIERGLDEWVAGLERNAERYQELANRVEAVRVSATSPSGVVTATVDANGALVDVVFTDRVSHTTADELRRQLMAAVGSARGQIVGEVRQAAGETLGPAAGDSAERIVGHYRERFPESTEPETPARRPRSGDDFEGGTIYD